MGWWGQVWDVLRANDVLVVGVPAAVALVSAFWARREAQRARRIETERLREEVDRMSLQWGQEVIDLVSAASSLPQERDAYLSEREFQARRAEISWSLSALVDRGRLFFPNVDTEKHRAVDRDKESAFTGKRAPILDALLYVHYEIDALGPRGGRPAAESCDFIVKCRRLIVSELQAYLDKDRLTEVDDRFDKRLRAKREAALHQAGRLGLELDARRPGTLVKRDDKGWTELIPAEERKQILAAVHKGEHP